MHAIKKGNNEAIIESWNNRQTTAKGFTGTEFQSFDNNEETETYLENRDNWIEMVLREDKEEYLVLFNEDNFGKKSKR